MPAEKKSVINIALVGGGRLCEEILKKTTSVLKEEEVHAPIVAVADPDPDSPGMVLARELGLLNVPDYKDLYDPKQNIQLIIILESDPGLFQDILGTRPPHIRLMSYPVFDIFWKAIGLEERKLRERTKEMETILNGIQNFISVIDPDMEIVEVNEGFLKQMRCTRDEVIGRKCYEVFQGREDPCQRGEAGCPLKEVIRNKSHARQIMTRHGSDGVMRYFEVNIYPIWEQDGRISRFIEISRDITEHKREEEEITRRLEQMVEERTRELKETHNKLLHQDKMASLGKLSASVVHEINNPIAGILNLIMLTKRIIAEDQISGGELDPFSEYLDLMETETRRISQIVSNLLAFSRQSKMGKQQISLNRLVDKTLFLNANLLKLSGVKVAKKLDPELPDVMGSEDQVQQVFMNIVSNAAEAMEPEGGGILTIETRRPRREGKITVSFSDSGPGIPPENLPKVFEPFFTTKTKGKGVGLGLSVAYGIVQEHGGTIHAHSGRGKGATFKVAFPLEPMEP
jgi:PAS domain S-box-containing protein